MPLVLLEGTGDSATAEDVATPHLPAPNCTRVLPASKLPLGFWGAAEGHSGKHIICSPTVMPRAWHTPSGSESWAQERSQMWEAVCCARLLSTGLTPPLLYEPAALTLSLSLPRRGVVLISGWIALWGGIC